MKFFEESMRTTGLAPCKGSEGAVLIKGHVYGKSAASGQPDSGKGLFLPKKDQGSWEKNLSWCQNLREGIICVIASELSSCGLKVTAIGDHL